MGPAAGQSEVVPQSGTQSPPTQNGAAPEQTVPHFPQFDGLVFVSTHAPLQASVPARQSTPHPASTHVSPGEQAFPQALQLSGSELVSVHTPLQTVRSVVHGVSKSPLPSAAASG